MPQDRKAKLEALLEQDPDDVFLRYALALEYLKSDECEGGVARLKELTERAPDYVPPYFQLGQHFAAEGDIEEARIWLESGIATARRVGDQHALGEMTDYLDTL